MNRSVRLVVFGIGATCLALLYGLAVVDLPPFGTDRHPYRDHAVAAAVRHATPNVVSAVTFDQRGLDTLGEEIILLGSVVGAATLLRPGRGEREHRVEDVGRQPDAVVLVSYLMLPLTLLLGVNLVLHGHLTPGGGFQGGVVLSTGLHLLYLSGSYRALARLRPLAWYEWSEGGAAAGLAGIGLAGIATGHGLLANLLPQGRFQDFLSAGTVPVLNVVVGFAVGTAVVVLLAQFLAQALATSPRGSGGG